MSAFDQALQVADDAIFSAFGDPATVRRGAGAAVPVRVAIERGVAVLGEFGQVTGRVDMATFRNQQWNPVQGDILNVAGVDRKIDEVDYDDGHATRVVLYG